MPEMLTAETKPAPLTPHTAEALGVVSASPVGLPPILMPPARAPLLDPTREDSYRHADPSQMKGQGFFGPLEFHDGRTSTELSIGVEIGGKETEIPSLVPTLTREEINHLLSGGEPTPEIVKKAVEFAQMRIQQGLSPFATEQDQPISMPLNDAKD